MSERGTIQDYASGLRADRGDEDRWLSIYEVAAMTLQHPDSVRRWVVGGAIQSEDRSRLGHRIRESEVERFVHDHFLVEGRNPADKALSSNLFEVVKTDALDEHEAQGAGWPFHSRPRDSSQP